MVLAHFLNDISPPPQGSLRCGIAVLVGGKSPLQKTFENETLEVRNPFLCGTREKCTYTPAYQRAVHMNLPARSADIWHCSEPWRQLVAGLCVLSHPVQTGSLFRLWPSALASPTAEMTSWESLSQIHTSSIRFPLSLSEAFRSSMATKGTAGGERRGYSATIPATVLPRTPWVQKHD